MDDTYGAVYATLYRQHWWWRAREEYLTRLIEREIRTVPEGDVLDFGCGDGLFFPVLKRFGEVYGVEPALGVLDPNGPHRARIMPNVRALDRTRQARFRLVVALDVFEHMPTPERMAVELVQRLKPGGLLLATVPAFQLLWTAHDVVNHHVKRYSLREITTLVRNAGLEVVDARYFFMWLAPLKLAVAGIERARPRSPRPARVPSPRVNGLALWISRFEQRLLGARRPPFGSSALVLARKPA